MVQQMIRNEEGEVIGVDFVRDQYEEEEAWCEEMQMRAEDPFYAARQEDAYWYQQALSCFEEKGIEVPEDVIVSLKNELRKKEQDRQKEQALKEVEPTLNYLKEKLPHCEWYANYYGETADECGGVEIGCKYRPYAWELAEVIASCGDEEWNKGISIEDYFSYRDCKTAVGYCQGEGYARFVRDWTAVEHCGNDFLFAVRRDWWAEGKKLQAVWAISPSTDAIGNSRWDAFKKSYPESEYHIWSGEIIHKGDYNDIICFGWS